MAQPILPHSELYPPNLKTPNSERLLLPRLLPLLLPQLACLDLPLDQRVIGLIILYHSLPLYLQMGGKTSGKMTMPSPMRNK